MIRILPRNPSIFVASCVVKMLILAACAQNPEPAPSAISAPLAPPTWTATDVQHVYGLMEARPRAKGTLSLTASSMSFEGKGAHVLIPRVRLLSLSTGHDRVEMFGTTGQILRMVIPDGGGLAAAAVMHHRVDMLTVQYLDAKGGEHAAVFYLPAVEAERALAVFGKQQGPEWRETADSCHGALAEPGSVLVTTSGWEQSQVPAAYRALVYEHVIERLRKQQGVRYVYREGEDGAGGVCAQHVITLMLNNFRPGNQVKRSALGPIGMFVGTTQMTVSARITEQSGGLASMEEIKSSVRSQSESVTVADKIAKAVAKRYGAAVAHPRGDAPRSPAGSAQPSRPASSPVDSIATRLG